MIKRAFSIAPMMKWTDTHYRTFARTLTQHALLYTEMITAPALCYGDVHKHLAYNEEVEHPVAVQLGGSDITSLVVATKYCHAYNYDEINLNVGCPSSKVQSGKFGAILMRDPLLVADCLKAMHDNTDKPVSVKHRIGLDDDKDYDILRNFVETVSENSPCKIFIIHARVSMLQGLSPKKNRNIPPLKYDFVHRIKKDFPHLTIIINGGVTSMEAVQHHLSLGVDGVMVGRSAYHTPYDVLATADRDVFSDSTPVIPRIAAMKAFLPYVNNQLKQGVRLSSIMCHTLGMFHGCRGGRRYRQTLAHNMYKKGAGISVVEQALSAVV